MDSFSLEYKNIKKNRAMKFNPHYAIENLLRLEIVSKQPLCSDFQIHHSDAMLNIPNPPILFYFHISRQYSIT